MNTRIEKTFFIFVVARSGGRKQAGAARASNAQGNAHSTLHVLRDNYLLFAPFLRHVHTDGVPGVRQADEISYIALLQSLFKRRIVEPSVHSAENQRIDVSERLDGAHDGIRDSRYAVVDELLCPCTVAKNSILCSMPS